jgi:tRNA nucleotidyltransferase (CCA-adding enzyme)
VTVEHLLRGVKQLSPVELDEFTQKFTEWQQLQEVSISKEIGPEASDAEVLAFIRKNSRLPEKENRHYWQLRRKREDETLSDNEISEYEELIRQLDTMNIKRLEALAILVRRWGKPVREIMAELGLFISHFDEPEFAEESAPENYTAL